MISTTSLARPHLRFALGAATAGAFDTGLPVLGGLAADALFPAARPAGRAGALTLFATEGWLLGAATVPVEGELAAVTRQLYADLLKATHGRHLARIWNFVPAINEEAAGGLEHYREFCQGRSLAFEERYGRAFTMLVPAASAVGCGAAALTVAFVACDARPRHIENPLQVPAYLYPPEYGPRAPSFARATVVAQGGAATVFISGTAAIRGHVTVAPEGIAGQLACTLENLRELSRACGLGPDLGRGGRAERHFKVYVRRAADQPMIAAALDEGLLRAGDHVSYLLADICRRPLLVEIEATLFGATVTAGQGKLRAES